MDAALVRRDGVHDDVRLVLTFTPERAGGLDVRSFFEGPHRGRAAAGGRDGSRICRARSYFAVADGTDLRRVRWSRGRYGDAELAGPYTDNRARASIVLA